ncbi:3,4-dihydroxyphenylacetaldehyde synthase 2-like [Macrosteles quadrilineatus]|uniref:3,4-dihydroxyphenylacetaldehyde synthase 2-like n=1 Tax=Macrosteles quadrilineatus TaxID=74068 RepID=UPI0023E1905E|nr:3,4-dihydroxyphenylacetaldehyde synthase 2-like [Macrosteles quadrilineatus]XP_054282190.1 3,4-dihydroxyphenylacetaldehyde synthase 2-like [Macrosteles quadrilineatus]XP_054282191.1 3,4-dihydroxyphenylacetaldehyde synthase 2-like [Macrosteles quadrilineatus]
MDSQQFREFGKAAIDYLAEYYETVRDRPVLPSVNPGYLRPLVADSIPEDGQSWQDILKDMDTVVMPGVTHWQAPGFHSYYPTASSFPSIIGELMSAGLGVMGFSWMTSPACTELEMVMMDWLAKAMDLPTDLLNSSDSEGGGCLQGSASEATLMGLLVAKEKAVRRLQKEHPELSEQDIKAKLVCYSSDQSNSSVEKAGMLASVPMRLLPADENGSLRGETVRRAIEEDISKGLIPCYLVANYGTTATCAFDNLDEIGPVCQAHNVWLHLDAAYAGVALICPELRHYMPSLHHADSMVTNLHKWLLVNFDCSAMWFKSCRDIVEAFTVERIYLAHRPNTEAPDLRNWQIPLGRRFRSLKIWFTLRTYGLKGLQQHIRNHVALAGEFEKMILADSRFELASPTCMGLVCFRAKGENSLSTSIVEELNRRKKVYMIPGKLMDSIFIRFVVCSPSTTVDDVKNCVDEIIAATDIVMEQQKENTNSGNKIMEQHPLKKISEEKVETVVNGLNGIHINGFSKEEKPSFCTPRLNIANVARS